MAVESSLRPRWPRRRTSRRPSVTSLLAIPVVIALWALVSSTSVVSSAVLPTPVDVATGVVHAASSSAHFQLEEDALATLRRLLIGTGIAAVIGIPVGVALGARRWLRAVAQPVLLVGLTLPALALAPLYMVFFGLGETVTLAVVVVEAIVPMIITVATGYRSIPTQLLWVARALGARRTVYWRSVALPALTAPIVTGLRTGMGYAWRSLLAVEGITALKYGLGYRAFQAGQYFDSRGVFVDVITVAIIGIILESVILGRIEKATIVRWGVAQS